jgi:hypothetical protein
MEESSLKFYWNFKNFSRIFFKLAESFYEVKR